MTEKMSFSEFQVSKHSRKRRILEEETASISTINIDRLLISEDISLVADDVPIVHTSDDCKWEDADLLVTESQLDMSTLNQYVRLLVEECKLWILEDSKYMIISAFETIQGKVHLNKKMIVIDINLKACLYCLSDSCLHFEASELCLEYNTYIVCKFSQLNKVTYYLLNEKNLFLLENEEYHSFYCKKDVWSCNTCSKICKMISTVHTITVALNIGHDTNIGHKSNSIEYPTISTLPIPLAFDDKLSSVYSQQLSQGFQLPPLLIPEKQNCAQGYPFNTEDGLSLERIGIILYLENDILEYKDYKVFSSRCNGPCRCIAVFEGRNNLILNIKNRYFIHYGLLYEYSELMTKSRTTLYGYLCALNSKFQRMGRKLRLQYHVLRHAWNAFLRMAEVDYQTQFSCPLCKDKPDVIIMDGIAMGTTKPIPESHPQVDETQHYSMVPFSERSFISKSELRSKLHKLCEMGLPESTFRKVIDSIPKELADYIVHTTNLEESRIVSVNSTFPDVRSVIKHLCHAEPLPGLFQFSILNHQEKKVTASLSLGESVSTNELPPIYRKMHILEILFNSVPPATIKKDNFKLHHVVASLLQGIMSQIEHLFKRPSRNLIEYTPPLDDYYNYFPTFSTHYKIPSLESDTEDIADRCSKSYPKHTQFSPGLIIIVCKHRICYGFQIMRQRESTIDIFNMLISLFRVQPKVIIYDNACNLHKTCMMRDPKLFRNTTFLIDRFHYRNHKCNLSYSMKYIKVEEFEKINSQTCEQIFSSLRRIATQIAYMRIENVFYTTRYFLTSLNQNNRSKIADSYGSSIGNNN